MNNIKKIQHSILGFDKYIKQDYENSMEVYNSKEILNEEDTKQLGFITNNYDTVRGVLQNYHPSAQLLSVTSGVQRHINIYIIMENWCGSSAGNVPFIVKLLQTLPSVNITIVPRDTNEDFMNAYLSDGKKSIPMVIGFDDNDAELFVWGSSTKSQMEYVKSLQAQNLPFPDFVSTMRTWFKENNATAIEQEFIEILETINNN
jgi:hypothetical protein